jgi:hypothetical protein
MEGAARCFVFEKKKPAQAGRPQKRGATPISYKVLQCPTKLLHTSSFNLKNASPSQAYDCKM